MAEINPETTGTEGEFLVWYHQKEKDVYPKTFLTVDNITFAWDIHLKRLRILLIRRKQHPFQDCWALPGGFVSPDEDVLAACLRETKEETGITILPEQAEQLFTFSNPNRDPRAWVVSCAHLSFLPQFPEALPGSDAKEAHWFVFDCDDQNNVKLWSPEIGKIKTEALAFDHYDMLQMARKRLLGRMHYNPTFLYVLGETFVLSEAISLYRSLNGYDASTSNFLLMHRAYLEQIGTSTGNPGRPARVFKFKKQGGLSE